MIFVRITVELPYNVYCYNPKLNRGDGGYLAKEETLFLPGLPFRKRRVINWPGFFLRRRIALCSLKRMPILAQYHVIYFRQIHWLRGKIPLTCCREQKAAFWSVCSVNVVVLLPL